jgi:hypothetical protein
MAFKTKLGSQTEIKFQTSYSFDTRYQIMAKLAHYDSTEIKQAGGLYLSITRSLQISKYYFKEREPE